MAFFKADYFLIAPVITNAILSFSLFISAIKFEFLSRAFLKLNPYAPDPFRDL
jgi:hypothetical protein